MLINSIENRYIIGIKLIVVQTILNNFEVFLLDEISTEFIKPYINEIPHEQ